MKKSILFIALTSALATSAHAESTVSLYGLVDTAYAFKQVKVTETLSNGTLFSRVKSRALGIDNGFAGGSYWGMEGVEDLGNGTRALFALESGFNASNGSAEEDGALFNGHAYLGLSNDVWGSFTIGHQGNVADEFMSDVDPFGTDFGQAGAGSVFGDSLGTTYSRSIKYMSPDMDGFQFGTAITYNKEKRTINGVSVRDDNTGVSVGLKYGTDKAFFGLVYDTLKSTDSVRSHSWALGGSYDFDVAKIYGAFGQQRDGIFGDIFPLAEEQENLIDGTVGATPWNGRGYRQSAWLAGLSAPVGDNGTLMFSYQGISAKNKIASEPVKSKAHIFSLGYSYDLSKRTAVYGFASYGNAKNHLYTSAGTLDHIEKVQSTQVAIGLRHYF